MRAGWDFRPLGSIAKFQGGGTPSKDNASYWTGNIPWVSPKDMKAREISASIDAITHEAIKNSAASLIPKGAILVVVRSGILARTIPLAVATRELAVNQDIKAICPQKALDGHFLLYYLQSSEQRILQRVTRSATVHRLETGVLRNLEIPLPPLPEQRRIVAVLDEAFAGLEAMRANAEKNLQNARELFGARLNAIFAEDYENEVSVSLAEIATDITDGDHMPPPKSESGVPFITIGNVDKVSRKIDFTDTFLVPLDYHSRLKPYRRPKKGDVLYTVTGSYGIPILVEDDTQFCFQRHIGLIRPKPAIDSAWLNYLLLSRHVFKQAEAGATGTAQKTVSLKVLRNFVVPFPPMQRQKATAAWLDKLAVETSRLAELYQQKLAAIEELKQSILQKAFAGELTAAAAVAA